ncbi:MAG: hypothetical protein JJU00_09930 [Opitutales bacterium]|nr:hypothetical protein [Opitutales bacterium]
MPESPDETSDEDYEIARAMESRQIGVVGEITAARKVRTVAAKDVEGSAATSAGIWQFCLYMEWFGQNGRVVAELPGAHIRLLDIDVPPVDDDPAPPESGPAEAESALGDEAAWDGGGEPDDDTDEDPYHLFDEDLEAQIAASADTEDGFFSGSDEGADIIDNLERMDAQMESGDTMPMRDLLDGGTVLPAADEISEDEAAALLKKLLARFALFGIAFDMCEHATARQAYQVLLEDVIDGENVLPGMFGSGWVQHFGTHDSCPECQRELDEEMGGSGRDPAGDPDDEAPF